MRRSTANRVGWLAYFGFALTMFYVGWHETLFSFDVPYGWAKLLTWIIFLAFLVYSIHCSRKENIFSTIKVMNGLYWGRQIGTDLYIGVTFFLFLVLVHSGSPLTLLIWVVPILLFANLATLLYLLIHFDSIVGRLLA